MGHVISVQGDSGPLWASPRALPNGTLQRAALRAAAERQDVG